MLTRLYRASPLHTNLMQPSFKLKSKTRSGAQVVKQYHPPVPPAHRVLLHQAVSGEAKAALQQQLAVADPVLLFTEIRAAQAELGRRVDRRSLDGATSTGDQAQNTALTIAELEVKGGQRAIHRRSYIRRKPVPK